MRARKPLGESRTSVRDSQRTSMEPKRWSHFLSGEKCWICEIGRSPTTMSARASRSGRTSAGMSSAQDRLSASVLTTKSAPFSTAFMAPTTKAVARPMFHGSETT